MIQTLALLAFVLPAVGSTAGVAGEQEAIRAWAAGAFHEKTDSDAVAIPLDTACPPFSFEYGGTSSRRFLASWKKTVENGPAIDGRRRHSITYTDPASMLQVVCEITEFVDFPAVEWVLRFRNGGESDTPLLENIRPLDLNIAATATEPVILHHSRGSESQPTDFLPIDSPLVANAKIDLAPDGGRSSSGKLPFFNLQWNGGGLVGAIGWSGQWAMLVRRGASGVLTLQAGQQMTHFVLHPKEDVRSPRILLTLWQGDNPLRGNNLFRRLLVAHYLPKRNGELAVAPIAWNSWFAFDSGNGVNEKNQLDWIVRESKTGAECYWLDAGWFEGGWPNGAGNWTPGKKQFPRGLRPLGDAAHKVGMKFVLWFEPERVTPNSRIAKEHPQWVLQHKATGDGLFNLGDPAARAWLTDYLSQCLRDWDVDVFRIDFNRVNPLVVWRAHDAPDRQGITEIRYIEGLYRFWDELVRRRPGLTIDNCSSGGRRIDLETLSRSYPLWRSDYPCRGPHPTADQIETAGLSLYVPQHTSGVWLFDPYGFRSAATMGASFCPDLRSDKLPLGAVRRAICEVKELRPLYFGDYYPLLPINDSEQAWCSWQFDRPDLGKGFVMLFRRPQSPCSSVDIKLFGLDPEATYEVEYRESYAAKKKKIIAGAELSLSHIAIDKAPGSLLIVYKKIQKAN